MKNTGVVRKVDELGRVVIPIEIRNKFQIEEHTELEIFVDKGNIILHKNSDKECPICHKKCNEMIDIAAVADLNLMRFKNELHVF